jgi:hypothetical protein
MIERYGWKPGERQKIMDEMAERQRQIDSARILDEAHQAASRTFTNVGETVSRDYLPPRQRAAPAITKDWQDYVARQIDAREKIMQKAIAQVMVEEEREREKVAAELEPLRERVATLESELGEFKRECGRRGHHPLDASGV